MRGLESVYVFVYAQFFGKYRGAIWCACGGNVTGRQCAESTGSARRSFCASSTACMIGYLLKSTTGLTGRATIVFFASASEIFGTNLPSSFDSRSAHFQPGL